MRRSTGPAGRASGPTGLAGASVAHDLIVVLPGIMGSTLVKDGREVWAASAGSMIRAIRSFGASVRGLTLGEVGDDDPGDGVTAGRLMPDLHALPGVWTVNLGYGALIDRLRGVLRVAGAAPGANVDPPNLLAVPYDWRLSNRLNGRRLKGLVEPAVERLRARGGRFADAQVTFVCHSMGGLVARWYIEKEGGWEVTRTLVTIGTPHRGALKALDELVNGVHKGLGPFATDLSGFARSLPSAYQLLPEYACIASDGRLLKTTETVIPQLDANLVSDGAAFHADLDAAARARSAQAVDLRPIVGTKQATFTTATIVDERLQAVETIDGDDERGDATVPRLSGTPTGMAPNDAAVHWVAARHGALQSAGAVLDQVEGLLTVPPIRHRALVPAEIGLRVPDLVFSGEHVEVEARLDGSAPGPLTVTVVDERGRLVDQTRLASAGDRHRARLSPLPAGGYVLTVAGYGSAAARTTPVTSPLLVWDREAA